jgi:hypothetical protein
MTFGCDNCSGVRWVRTSSEDAMGSRRRLQMRWRRDALPRLQQQQAGPAPRMAARVERSR